MSAGVDRRHRRRVPLAAAAVVAILLAGILLAAVLQHPAAPTGTLTPVGPTSSPVGSSSAPAATVVDRVAGTFGGISWSPDGRALLAIAQASDGTSEVRVYAADGRRLWIEPGSGASWVDATHVAVLVPDGPAVVRSTAGSPRITIPGSWVAVSGNGHGALALLASPGALPGATFTVWRLEGARSAPVPGIPAAWSPDGGRLAYWLALVRSAEWPGGPIVLAATGSATPAELAVLDQATMGQVIAYPAHLLDARTPPVWSPDGTWIAGDLAGEPLGPVVLGVPSPQADPSVVPAVVSLPANLHLAGWASDNRLLLAYMAQAATWESATRTLTAGLPPGARVLADPCGHTLLLDATGRPIGTVASDASGFTLLGPPVPSLSPDASLLAEASCTGTARDLLLARVADLASAPAPSPLALAPAASPSPVVAANGWPVTLPGDGTSTPVLGADGTLYVAVPDQGTRQPWGLYAFDASGHVRPGWPYRLPAAEPSPRLVAALDGTLYVGLEQQIVALGPDGTPRAGWPVAVRSTVTGMVLAADSTLYAESWSGSAAQGDTLSALGPDGRTKTGWPVSLPAGGAQPLLVATDGTVYDMSQLSGWPNQAMRISALDPSGHAKAGWPLTLRGAEPGMALAPDGTLYAWWFEGTPGKVAGWTISSTHLEALGLDGRPRSGWPVTIAGLASVPAFGAHGTAYLTLGSTQGGSPGAVLALDRSGHTLPGWPVRLPGGLQGLWALDAQPGGIGNARPPEVATDGTLVLGVWHASRDGTLGAEGTILLDGQSGTPLPGWPVMLPAGTMFARSAPNAVPGGAELPPLLRSDGGIAYGRMVAGGGWQVEAHDRQGRLVSGWPQRLPAATVPAWLGLGPGDRLVVETVPFGGTDQSTIVTVFDPFEGVAR
jgi:hypothetical protein